MSISLWKHRHAARDTVMRTAVFYSGVPVMEAEVRWSSGFPSNYLERAREAVRERFRGELGATPSTGILTARAVGDQHAISVEEWRLFNRMTDLS